MSSTKNTTQYAVRVENDQYTCMVEMAAMSEMKISQYINKAIKQFNKSMKRKYNNGKSK